MDDHPRILLLVAVMLWSGLVLLLWERRWFNRVCLAERLGPFAGASADAPRTDAATSFVAVLVPIVSVLGEKLSAAFGVHGSLDGRLERAGIAIESSAFRLKQFGWMCTALVLGVLATQSMVLPPLAGLLLVASPPLLAFLILEQQLLKATKDRQHRIFIELPIVAEQLAMLLGAGYSLGAGLNRLAERNTGATGRDLRLVCDRIRHGLSTAQALQEWSDLVSVPELTRLVGVLSVASDTSDLGRLVSAEAQAIRSESQRRLAESIDKRAQQVWVPVTVATLIPGVIFLVIPFLRALQIFSAS